ncbi:hypothetical protein BDF14DRAFT_1752740 [Spinellus fusiger]|nr:hypothetical protein BDF14DRAFT_1752740 [Spinellus fusiger]
MANASALVKPYLRKFVLQIHPDFFGHDLSKKKLNADSLQQLYTVLGPILKQTPSTVKESTRLLFYSKSDKRQIEGVFNQPSSQWSTLYSFLNLCQKVNIPITPTDMQIVEGQMPQPKKSTPEQHYLSLKQQFANALYTTHSTKAVSERTHQSILENRLLVIDPSLDKYKIAEQLSVHLPQLEPQHWWGRLPVMIVKSSADLSDLSTHGILVFTSDMQCSDMSNYLAENLERKTTEYKNSTNKTTAKAKES